MPNVSVYIREEDIVKWKELKSKTAFIHKALNHHAISKDATVKLVEEIVERAVKRQLAERERAAM